jgi:hypothetical protein
MIKDIVSCAIGSAMVVIFLGIMIRWVPAPPLIIIVVGVMAMMFYDFYLTLRYGENGKGR